jgi:hypothetical protein
MSSLGFHPTIVERPRNKLEAIAAARTALARCQFDEGSCELGLRRLRACRKEWNESKVASHEPLGTRSASSPEERVVLDSTLAPNADAPIQHVPELDVHHGGHQCVVEGVMLLKRR